MGDKVDLDVLSPQLRAAVETEIRQTAALMIMTLHRSMIARVANVLYQHVELQELMNDEQTFNGW